MTDATLTTLPPMTGAHGQPGTLFIALQSTPAGTVVLFRDAARDIYGVCGAGSAITLEDDDFFDMYANDRAAQARELVAACYLRGNAYIAGGTAAAALGRAADMATDFPSPTYDDMMDAELIEYHAPRIAALRREVRAADAMTAGGMRSRADLLDEVRMISAECPELLRAIVDLSRRC